MCAPPAPLSARGPSATRAVPPFLIPWLALAALPWPAGAQFINFYGFGDESDPATNQVGNGTTFLVRSTADNDAGTTPAPDLPGVVGDSSMPGTTWWSGSKNTAQPEDIQSANTTGIVKYARFDDPVDFGGSFYFGHSWENSMEIGSSAARFLVEPIEGDSWYGKPSMFFDQQGNRLDNGAPLPEGTRAYYGFANLGSPADFTVDNVSNPPAAFLSPGSINPVAAPPAGLFPTPGNFSWVQVTKEEFAEGPQVRWLVPFIDDVTYTEWVVVVVLPDQWRYDPLAGNGSRTHFYWSMDVLATGEPNPSAGNILAPEPGRTALVGLALTLLLLGRSRGRGGRRSPADHTVVPDRWDGTPAAGGGDKSGA